VHSGMVRTHICMNVVIVFSEFNSCMRSVTDTCGAAGSVNVIIGFNDHCYSGCTCLYGYPCIVRTALNLKFNITVFENCCLALTENQRHKDKIYHLIYFILLHKFCTFLTF